MASAVFLRLLKRKISASKIENEKLYHGKCSYYNNSMYIRVHV